MPASGATRVAIVTGASSGIGRAVALRLAAAGRTVVAAARRAAELDALAAGIGRTGGQVVAAPTDVSKLEDIEALLATVLPAAIDRQFAGTAGGAPPPPMRVAKIAQLVQKARQNRQMSDPQAPGR